MNEGVIILPNTKQFVMSCAEIDGIPGSSSVQTRPVGQHYGWSKSTQ